MQYLIRWKRIPEIKHLSIACFYLYHHLFYKTLEAAYKNVYDCVKKKY